MTRPKQYHPDELNDAQRERSCPACRMKWRVPLSPKDLYGPLHIDRSAYRWLQNAARVFVKESGEDYWSAEDFVAWIKSDIYGERPLIVDHDGAPPRTASGSLAQNYADGSVHRHPFPLPIAGWRPGEREGTG